MLFDTHCHLNIEVLSRKLDEVVSLSKELGIEKILIPGVTLESCQSAIEIAEKYAHVYVGVGIHPTEINQKLNIKDEKCKSNIKNYIDELETLIVKDKVVTVGEIGLDYYVKNKEEGVRSKASIESQKELFIEQLKLALQYKKSVIIHNRESKEDLLKILNDNWSDFFSYKMVFHCCEPDMDLLNFAKEKNIFIGVDGDITYKKSKQEFIKNIPLDLLVLETDSPFLVPEPLKTQKIFPNEPKNITIVANYVCDLLNIDKVAFEKQIWENSNKLFFD